MFGKLCVNAFLFRFGVANRAFIFKMVLHTLEVIKNVFVCSPKLSQQNITGILYVRIKIAWETLDVLFR